VCSRRLAMPGAAVPAGGLESGGCTNWRTSTSAWCHQWLRFLEVGLERRVQCENHPTFHLPVGRGSSIRSQWAPRKKLPASIPEHSWGHAPSRIRWHGCTSDIMMLVASGDSAEGGLPMGAAATQAGTGSGYVAGPTTE
jgi:hypothetical protein